MYADKLAAGSRDCSRVPNIVEKLIIYLVCLCTGLAPSLAFAIDPYVPGFTLPSASAGSTAANAARAASAGGSLGASAAGLGAAAAALGAFGLGFCAASYVMGTNSCGPGGSLSGGLGAAGITQNPDSGALEKQPPSPSPCISDLTPTMFCGPVFTQGTDPTYICVDTFWVSTGLKTGGGFCKPLYTPPKRPPTESEVGEALGGPNASPATQAAAAAAAGAAAHSLSSGATARAATAAADAAAASAKPENAVCTTGNHLNPQTGACAALAGEAAPEATTCAAPLILNTVTNGCSLPRAEACAAGAVYDFISKKCIAVDNTVKQNTGTGALATDFEIPAFCDWAKPVCTAIEWATEEPIPATANDPKNGVENN